MRQLIPLLLALGALLTAAATAAAVQPLAGQPAVAIPPVQRAVVCLPVALAVEATGIHVLTDLVEFNVDRPLAEQAPQALHVLALENDAYRALRPSEEWLGFRVPPVIEVDGFGTPYIPRDVGHHLDTKRAGPTALAALSSGGRGTDSGALTIPVRYTDPQRICPQAYGPKALARSDAAGCFATVPQRVLIDERGEFHIVLHEIGPLAAPPGLADLPATTPVFSRFADGLERRGAYRRNYADVAVHHLSERRAVRFTFSPGLGYQFIPGEVMFCGTGLDQIKPVHQPGAFAPDPMPDSESVPVIYQLSPATIRTLTPTLRWAADPSATSHHTFICEGAQVDEELQVFEREKVAGTSITVPEGFLRPGMTYHWLVTAENVVGYSYRVLVFATSPDAASGVEQFLDAPPVSKDDQ